MNTKITFALFCNATDILKDLSVNMVSKKIPL